MEHETTLGRSDYGHWGYSQPDNGVAQLYVRLHDFGGDELALYMYLYARKWNRDDDGDYKRGAANMTQETIMADLNMGDRKLKKVKTTLERYGLLRTEMEKRKHGGYPQTYYWPLEPIYDVTTFLTKYGEELREGQRERLEEAANKQQAKSRVVQIEEKRVLALPTQSAQNSGPTYNYEELKARGLL